MSLSKGFDQVCICLYELKHVGIITQNHLDLSSTTKNDNIMIIYEDDNDKQPPKSPKSHLKEFWKSLNFRFIM